VLEAQRRSISDEMVMMLSVDISDQVALKTQRWNHCYAVGSATMIGNTTVVEEVLNTHIYSQGVPTVTGINF
jgi:hypothetical protein